MLLIRHSFNGCVWPGIALEGCVGLIHLVSKTAISAILDLQVWPPQRPKIAISFLRSPTDGGRRGVTDRGQGDGGARGGDNAGRCRLPAVPTRSAQQQRLGLW